MLKKNQFIEIEYTGEIQSTNKIFDTTSKKIAKKEKIYNPKTEYQPIIICLGQNQILPGLDEQLENKELNKEYKITIQPEKAFGKKNPKLMRLVSASSFKKQDITPFPGLQINLDGILGTIRTVTPGRVIVDFNHPLAGQTLIYEIKINKIITDSKTQLDSLISKQIKEFSTEIKNNEAIIKAKLSPKFKEQLNKTIPTLINSIKKVIIKEE